MHNHNNPNHRCHRHIGLLSAVAFAIIAVLHLIRIILGWSIVLDGQEIPIWASIVCVVITGGLAAWNLCCCCCKKSCAPCQVCKKPGCAEHKLP